MPPQTTGLERRRVQLPGKPRGADRVDRHEAEERDPEQRPQAPRVHVLGEAGQVCAATKGGSAAVGVVEVEGDWLPALGEGPDEVGCDDEPTR